MSKLRGKKESKQQKMIDVTQIIIDILVIKR